MYAYFTHNINLLFDASTLSLTLEFYFYIIFLMICSSEFCHWLTWNSSALEARYFLFCFYLLIFLKMLATTVFPMAMFFFLLLSFFFLSKTNKWTSSCSDSFSHVTKFWQIYSGLLFPDMSLPPSKILQGIRPPAKCLRGEGTCCQASWPEINLWGLCDGRRAPTLKSLFSGFLVAIVAYSHPFSN